MENDKEKILEILLRELYKKLHYSYLISKEDSEIVNNLSQSYCDLFLVFDYEKQNKANESVDRTGAKIAKKTLAKLREESDILKRAIKKE